MKNREKYAEEIMNYNGTNFCKDFIKPIIHKKENCCSIGCERCAMLTALWLEEEYTEPIIDWSKVYTWYGEEKLDYARILTNAEAEKWDKCKDLEEQGRLITLPCSVGDTVWLIGKNYNKCTNHYDCEHYDYNEYLIIWCEKNCPNGFRGTGVIQAIIETIEINREQVLVQLNAHDNYLRVPITSVFLTKEEAEAKLAEMEGAE